MGINFGGVSLRIPAFKPNAQTPATAYKGLTRNRPPLKPDPADYNNKMKMSGGSKNCDTSGTNADNESG